MSFLEDVASPLLVINSCIAIVSSLCLPDCKFRILQSLEQPNSVSVQVSYRLETC